MNNDWPAGRAVFVNESKELLIWVNEEDHLRIISMQRGPSIHQVFQRLCDAVQHIEEHAQNQYMHDWHLGYVTCCPTNLGTALRASVHVNLPMQLCDRPEFNDILDEYMMKARPIYQGNLSIQDGIFDISNRIRIGKSECMIIQDLINCVQQLVNLEVGFPQ